MKSFKILSFILALTLVFASMTTVAFADVTEVGTIVADIDALYTDYKYRVGKADEEPKGFIPNDYEGKKSLQFSNDSYNYGSNAGNENAIQFIDSSSVRSLGQTITWTDYDSLKIETAIWIGDDNDGLGFRFRRYADDGKTEYKESFNGTSQTPDFYVAVGGKDYDPGTVAYGYSYVAKALNANAWNIVVIELGSTTNKVEITVDNKVETVIMKQFNSQNETAVTVTGLPEGSHGFCGSRNRIVLVPKSLKKDKLDVRLANFSMKAMPTTVSPEPETPALPDDTFEVTDLSVYYHGTGEETKTVGKATAINTTGKQQQVVIIVADYDEYNNMLKAKQSVVKFDPSNTEKVEQSNTMVRYSGTTPIKYSKAFVWDNLSGDIKPLRTSVSTQKDE